MLKTCNSRRSWAVRLLSLLAFSFCAHAADPPTTETEVMGYSPELGALFAQVYGVPDNGKCVSYILDFSKKIRFVLRAQPDIAKAVVALGEDDERSSCQLRSFDAQLEIKLKTAKTMSAEEKSKYEGYNSSNWSQPIEGFKDKTVNSFGQWLRKERPAYAPGLADKLFELGTTEAEDGNWLDSYDALVIATELKPQVASKEARTVAAKVMEKTASEKNSDKARMMYEVVTRLDARAARPLLKLASSGIGYERAVALVEKALKIDPVATTRAYREDAAFSDLRCHEKAAAARKRLPEALIQDVNCPAK
ncbi:MAG: hypothetical protein KF799_09715 [Bdellovibrionales bacterium]|nr:hypothetical protein [Bdellovibrionales bacterium]